MIWGAPAKSITHALVAAEVASSPMYESSLYDVKGSGGGAAKRETKGTDSRG